MPNDCDSGCTTAQEDALAELCYEVGVAFEMDYGRCGSGATTSDALTVLPTHFRYSSSAIDQENRNAHTAQTWFNLVKQEINASRPILYKIHRHAIVCDGWRDSGGQDEYHINYGWGGSHTAWYAVDNIHCDWDGCDPMVEYMIRRIGPRGACCHRTTGVCDDDDVLAGDCTGSQNVWHQDKTCDDITCEEHRGACCYLNPPGAVCVDDVRESECPVGLLVDWYKDTPCWALKCCIVPDLTLLDPRFIDVGHGTRNRYLSFMTGSTDLTEAMRVTFTSLPPPYDEFNGDRWWVGQPFEVTEASCCDGSTPPPTFWAATLQCETPHYDDWTQYGVVHVYDAGIIQGAAYDIQATSLGCDLANLLSYSIPLTINTSALGDVVGDCSVYPCTPPQGVIDFNDISAVVDKFRNLPTAPQKSRSDVINGNIAWPPPDRKVDFVDISCIVDAFRGVPCPLPGPQAHCP